MWLVPYRGQGRTFVTSLSVDECLTRLRSKNMAAPKKRRTSWLQFPQNAHIWRKLDGHRFSMLWLVSARRPVWHLFGELTGQDEGSAIHILYRLSWINVLLYWFYTVVVGLICVVLGGLVMSKISRAEQSIVEIVFATVFIVVGLFFILVVPRWLKQSERLTEARIVAFLCHLLDAEEVTERTRE